MSTSIEVPNPEISSNERKAKFLAQAPRNSVRRETDILQDGQSDRRAGGRRRLLLISYSFPPVGGAGVQRAVKFVKYLPRLGWKPTVLTVENPSVPVEDASLSRDISAECQVIRTRTWEPSYQVKTQLASQDSGRKVGWKSIFVNAAKTLLQPDPQCLWTWPTRFQMRQIEQAGPFDAVMVTGPPFSTFELGRVISRRFQLPLLLDFRDEWLLSVQTLEQHQHGSFGRARQQRLFRRALKSADGITATTQASADYLQQHCRVLGKSIPITAVYNGFDPDDFQFEITGLNGASYLSDHGGDKSASEQDFVLAYHGTLWNLTDCSPLVDALRVLDASRLAGSERIALRVVGRVTSGQQAALEQLQRTSIRLDQRPYVPHVESVRLAKEADLLVLLLTATDGAERVVPAKLFEYLALNRPILAITPPGETADLLRRYSAAGIFEPHEVHGIANWIRNRAQAGRPSDTQTHRGSERLDLKCCSRPYQTQQLVDLLNELVKQN